MVVSESLMGAAVGRQFRAKMHKDKPPAKSSKRPQEGAAKTASKQKTSGSEGKKWFGKSTAAKTTETRVQSASTPSLNNNNEGKRNDSKNKRPLTALFDPPSNVTLRRGQQSSKIEGQTPEDLSRASSITNLNVEPKGAKAKPKKAESRDRLDKIGEKKHERKTSSSLNKNNNKDNDSEAHQEIEQLQKQLTLMAGEKSNLALQLGEQTGQLNSLHGEVAKLKMLQEQANQQLDQLAEENSILRNRLRDVAHSPLSDNEKQQLLYESRHHSSAPASIATNLLDEGGDVTACPTPDWDKHSSSNVSEISVACLQDKINQMQETHYSTNEELQATLQELTDLQKQLTELQQENERLLEEKNLMFESLCRQTERLKDSRNEVESLKQLLYKDDSGQFETAAEREQKLVDLLKSAQEERENLLMKQEQLGSDLQDSRSANIMHGGEIVQLSERVKTLESTLDAKHAEHKQLDRELALAKDQSSGRQIEINRLKDLLENARTKIGELEQDRQLGDKSELDELLDNARKEKDALESEVAHLKEQLALSKNETEKLKEQVSILQEECKVIRNNAKTTQSDLEYKVEKLLLEKNGLAEQLQQFQETINDLQVQSQCQLEDKRQLSAVLSETQRNLNESERKVMSLETELEEVKRLRQEQEEEWERFQNDLLTSVRVANDFKTEAQQDLQRMIMENKAERERVKQLEAQIDKLKGGSPPKLATPVIKRSHQVAPKKRQLSKEEELLMELLGKRYEEIDPNLPDDQLTEEQRVVKKLKTLYEAEPTKQKPVARKSKDKLAISKPLLNSVISNPKLEEIANDPKVYSVERASVRHLDDFLDDLERLRGSNLPNAPSETNGGGEVVKSKSLNDLKEAEDDFALRRLDNRNLSGATSSGSFLKPESSPPISAKSSESSSQKSADPELPESRGFHQFEEIREGSGFSQTNTDSSFTFHSLKGPDSCPTSDSGKGPNFRPTPDSVKGPDFCPASDSLTKSLSKSLPVVSGQEAPQETSQSWVTLSEFPFEPRELRREEFPFSFTVDPPAEVAPPKPKKNRHSSLVTFETLEEICNGIEPDTPEELLTKEQRLAVRLKAALGERKATLKKNLKIGRKKIVISSPVKESVVLNSKLLSFMEDPVVPCVDSIPNRSSSPVAVNDDSKRSSGSSAKSKSYDDITFTFKASSINMYSAEDDKSDKVEETPRILPPQLFRDLPEPPESPKIMTSFGGAKAAESDSDSWEDDNGYAQVLEDLPNTLEVVPHVAEGNSAYAQVQKKPKRDEAKISETYFEDDYGYVTILGGNTDESSSDDGSLHEASNFVVDLRNFIEEEGIDEEESNARRAVTRVYSQVVDEIKEKYRKSRDDQKKRRPRVDSSSDDDALKEKIKHLDEDETILVKGLIKKRSGRPLSDISLEDLLMVEELKQKYGDSEEDDDKSKRSSEDSSNSSDEGVEMVNQKTKQGEEATYDTEEVAKNKKERSFSDGDKSQAKNQPEGPEMKKVGEQTGSGEAVEDLKLVFGTSNQNKSKEMIERERTREESSSDEDEKQEDNQGNKERKRNGKSDQKEEEQKRGCGDEGKEEINLPKGKIKSNNHREEQRQEEVSSSDESENKEVLVINFEEEQNETETKEKEHKEEKRGRDGKEERRNQNKTKGNERVTSSDESENEEMLIANIEDKHIIKDKKCDKKIDKSYGDGQTVKIDDHEEKERDKEESSSDEDRNEEVFIGSYKEPQIQNKEDTKKEERQRENKRGDETEGMLIVKIEEKQKIEEQKCDKEIIRSSEDQQPIKIEDPKKEERNKEESSSDEDRKGAFKKSRSQNEMKETKVERRHREVSSSNDEDAKEKKILVEKFKIERNKHETTRRGFTGRGSISDEDVEEALSRIAKTANKKKRNYKKGSSVDENAEEAILRTVKSDYDKKKIGESSSDEDGAASRRPTIVEVIRSGNKEKSTLDDFLPLTPFSLDQPSVYEPVYANFNVNLPKKTETNPVVPKKPLAAPRNSSSFETREHKVYEEFGGGVKKSHFTIRYSREMETKKLMNSVDRFREKKSVSDLRKRFETKPESLNYDSLDRVANFHVLNNFPTKND